MKNNQRGFGVVVYIIVLTALIGVAYYMGWIPNIGGLNWGSDEPRSYQWTATDLGMDETGMPRTAVALTTGGQSYEIGIFDGTCAPQPTDLLENEEEKFVCWWAGGGKEIGVFNENGNYVVKVGDIDEGDAETGGFRGNFETIIEL